MKSKTSDLDGWGLFFFSSVPRCNVQGEDRRVLGLELDRDHHALFVAFSSCVIRVPLSRCSDYSTCKKWVTCRAKLFFLSCLPQWGVSQLDDWPITWLATARKRWIAPQGSWVRWGGWPDKTRSRNTSDSCRKEFRISPGCWRPRGRPKPTIWPGNIRQEELEDVSFTSHRLNPNVQSYLLWLQHVYELCHFFLLTTGGKKHPRHVQLAIKSGKSGPHEDSLKVCFRVLVDWMNSGGFGLRSELQNSWERARKVCKSNDVRTFGFSPATWTQIRFSSKRSGCLRREIFWKMTLLINRLIRFI